MIKIERMTSYTKRDLADLAKLMRELSAKFAGEIDSRILDEIVNSSERVQIVARDDETGRIVGAATLTKLIGPAAGRAARLDDFVVDSAIRGAGLGAKIWDEMIRWCRENNLTRLEFTSRPERTAAHQFYLKHGAVIRETTQFRVEISQQ